MIDVRLGIQRTHHLSTVHTTALLAHMESGFIAVPVSQGCWDDAKFLEQSLAPSKQSVHVSW